MNMDLSVLFREARPGSAMFKRAEQLKRWQESETNKEAAVLKEDRPRKINFTDGCVFLAACSAGDKDEVKRLLTRGADIDTANIDGLTGLHQACIDDNLEMVEFLVENGADINRGDNEGWTALHATASCGFVSIAKYLMEHGANVAAVNNDGELPIDIAESDEMEEVLQEEIDSQGIDCEAARNAEERRMLDDANRWHKTGILGDRPHAKSGATALHVAAAKGYIKVMSVLLQAGSSVNAQDVDGWTPLHAAAHWGQKEACAMLVENLCNMDVKNFSGQTAFDVSDPDTVKVLDELRKKQVMLQKERSLSEAIIDQKAIPTAKRKTSITRMSGNDKSNVISRDKNHDRVQVETKFVSDNKKKESSSSNETETTEEESEAEETESEDSEVEKRNKANKNESSTSIISNEEPALVREEKDEQHIRTREPPKQAPSVVTKTATDNEDDVPSWRRGLRKTSDSSNPGISPEIIPRSSSGSRLPANPPNASVTPEKEREPQRRRPMSLESDDRKREEIRIRDSSSKISTSSMSNAPSSDAQTSPTSQVNKQPSVTVVLPPPTATSNSAPSTPGTPGTPNGSNQIRRSFVPPVRDEESETQRKAHAKRVRETRRSTQGVTLEELKSAEQLIKKQQAHQQSIDAVNVVSTAKPEVTERVREPAVLESGPLERRPSWRIRLEQQQQQQQLQDTEEMTRVKRLTRDQSAEASDVAVPNRQTETDTSQVAANGPTPYLRRQRLSSSDISEAHSTSSIPLPPAAPGTTAVRTRVSRSEETQKVEGEENGSSQDSNLSSNLQTTQGQIQRRRRPKRRSTGVVYPDAEEGEGAKQNVMDHTKAEDTEVQTTSERGYSTRSSRYGSSGSVTDASLTSSRTEAPASRFSDRSDRVGKSGTELSSQNDTASGDKDYRKLYEDVKLENEGLREKLRKTEQELDETKQQLDKATQGLSRNSVSDTEKRERRALERKLSEMEEEVKQLEQLKADNQRLRDENGALIRVISKLSK